MRLSLKLNGKPLVIAAVSGPGFLSTHVNLHDRPKDADTTKTVRVVGFHTGETETVRYEWPSTALRVRDSVEITILDEGEGDAPAEVKKSSTSPNNLLSNVNLAKKVLATVSEFESQLMSVVAESERSEPAEEQKKLRQAIGTIVAELGDCLLYPIYRRHAQLVPDDLKGELL